MRYIVLIAATLALPTQTAPWWNVETTNDIDQLCRTFVEWQKIMKAENQPLETYAGTGMEKHCPGMI